MFSKFIVSFFAIAATLGAAAPTANQERATTAASGYEYIIIGSGAGGGTLAARLAIGGANVLLLEAGDDQGTSLQESIPAFFPAASEYTPMSWDFYVRHYPNDTREQLNTKATYETAAGEIYVGLSPPAGSTFKGIWYPRAATLGGSAAHNAMVTVYPHEEDWTLIQAITGDSSWAPANMRKYFQRLEKNLYLPTNNATLDAGHGFDGWLSTSEMPNDLILPDTKMSAMLAAAAAVTTGSAVKNISTNADLDSLFPTDTNTAYSNRDYVDTFSKIVTAITATGQRSSPRDFLVDTAAATNADGSKKYNLTIKTNTFVTKIRFTSAKVPVAVGVDYLEGASQYSADARASTAVAGTAGSVNATKEVIVAGGTFNTPQILKLSGIGPAAELTALGIKVVANLPGVGANLEDHYEISAVIKYDDDYEFLNGCTFLETADDACYAEYAAGTTALSKGAYATNLVPAAIMRKSSVSAGVRDSFIFGGPIKFTGYFQGYTAAAIADHKHWSWLSLKAHENNKAGTVTLRSTNPLDTPLINFNYFDAGTTTLNADNLDLQPQVEGIKVIREIYDALPAPYNNFTEVYPGPDVNTDAKVKEFIKNESWGHHASSTAKIGNASDKNAVLDTNFKVRGVKGLRVVDASVFPQVPGFFPVVSVYMIAEKAADVILAGK